MIPVAFILLAGSATAGLLALAALLRRPHTVAKVAFGAGMALFAAESAFAGLSSLGGSLSEQAYWLKWRHLASAGLPGIWIVFSVTYARGNHREFLARWWPVAAAASGLPLALGAFYFDELVFAVRPWQGQGRDGLFLSWPGNIIDLACLIGAVVALMNLERTFRSAVGVMRWRLKYTVLGLGVIFGERIYSCSQSFLLSAVQPSQFTLDAIGVIIGGVLMAVAFFRAGFFKVDVYPSQAFLFNSITAVFVGVYLLVVGVLAKVVGYFGRDLAPLLQGATVIVLMAALGIVLFSDRVKQAFRRFVSRHLRRPSYDYRQVWTRFTEQTASVVDPEAYARAVVKWIAETCEALSVTIWLVDEPRRRLSFGASTSLGEGVADRLLGPIGNMAELIQEMRQRAVPVDIDVATDRWVEALKQFNPEHFKTGGHRVCVPLVARAQLVGLLMVGDRVSGRAFSPEDLDLLKCLADQAASTLLSARLGQRLMESKQMEAFQTMSAFFVHDLKNTASTLSLMLQNLPVHFDNPEFRRDALRAVGKTVDHINDLIQRLGLLRRELELKPAEVDLNAVVQAALTAVSGAPGVQVETALGDLPRIRADREQLGKVLTNLLLNARDALAGRAGGGRITVETGRDGDGVRLVVRDDGCGMSREFVEKQLFKPFQTTKKKGIGIGMFHSRMIVEAHDGRIEVETEAGVGTAFKVYLPIGGADERRDG